MNYVEYNRECILILKDKTLRLVGDFEIWVENISMIPDDSHFLTPPHCPSGAGIHSSQY